MANELKPNRTATKQTKNFDLAQLRLRAALLPEEFAAFFGRSKAWAYSMIYKGKVQTIKPLGEVMIPQSELTRLSKMPSE
jgi:outer membrane lipopolysaccharide assembly protein LptE/RlpB